MFDWSSPNIVYRGKKTSEEVVDIKSFQDSDSLERNVQIFPFEVNFSEGETLCRQLGGELPLPYDELDFPKRFVQLNVTLNCDFLWLPIHRKKDKGRNCFFKNLPILFCLFW